jgi:glycosyltransferase involved in cell wall biosynthesis
VVERFDLSAYDLVISDSHAVAKGVRRAPHARHLCYCHTPARFAWAMTDVYRERAARGSGARRHAAEVLLDRFRRWDVTSSRGVDHFVANSKHIARAIQACYGRDADVVYPPVDVARFAASPGARDDYFVTVSRLVPYKRVDLLIEAFRRLPDCSLVVLGDGPDRATLMRGSPANVAWRGFVDDEELARCLAGAQAFVYAAQEDFGITLVEAQAAGTPVIAYVDGGAPEIVRGLTEPDPTGVLFEMQTVDAIVAAVRTFLQRREHISRDACRANALRFAPEHFRAGLGMAIDRMYDEPQAVASPVPS